MRKFRRKLFSKKNMQRSHENSNSVVIKQARGGGTRTMNAQH